MACLVSLSHLPENNTDMARAELPAGIGTKCFVFCILSKKPLILRCPTIKWNTKKDKAACSPFLVQHQF